MSGRCVTASTEIWIVVVMVVILSPPTMSPSALKLTLPPTSPMRMPLLSPGDGTISAMGDKARPCPRSGQTKKMSRAQNERAVFHRELAYGLRYVAGFACESLQFVDDAAGAV